MLTSHIIDMTGGVLTVKQLGKTGNWVIVVHNESIRYSMIMLETPSYPRAVQVYQKLVKIFDQLNNEKYVPR